jgi:hypothetical protein
LARASVDVLPVLGAIVTRLPHNATTLRNRTNVIRGRLPGKGLDGLKLVVTIARLLDRYSM